MTSPIDAFGSEGSHEVHYLTEQGEQTVYVRRDLWFDRGDARSRVVWAQRRSWEHDDPPTDGDAEATSLGSIVVTHPAVVAFIDQLGELLVDPARFRDEPRFAEGSMRSDDD